MNGRTGALDPPGKSWRDRPAIDRGDGVFLAGDMVAAPGCLSEIAWASAVEAARPRGRGGGFTGEHPCGRTRSALASGRYGETSSTEGI